MENFLHLPAVRISSISSSSSTLPTSLYFSKPFVYPNSIQTIRSSMQKKLTIPERAACRPTPLYTFAFSAV